MATAPFTPFYNTPYAYPSSATAAYPPPASGSFPAPAYGPYSFPSTTTYPPPPYPGGYYTSPFPYAATYSYPPPTSACTPAAGFSPAPAYGPSTYPCAAASPCLTSTATPISTNAEPNWPPPAPESSHITPTSTPQANSPTPTHDSVQFSPPPPAGRPATAPLGSPNQVPGSPLPTNLSRPTPQWRDTIPAAPNRASCKSQRHTSSTSLDLSFPNPSTNLSSSKAVFHSSASRTQQDIELLLKFPDRDALPKGNNKKQADDQLTGMEVDAAVQAAVDESVPAKNAIHRRLQRELLNIQARLDQQQARDRTALYTLQGELAKFKSMASQLAVAMGMQTTDSPVTGSSPPVASAQFRSAATNASSSSDTSAAASLSASSLSSPVIASFAVPTLTSHSTVPADHANVASQVLEEMPQSYGLHNLTQRIVFRADGTEHRYYALPDTCPSERAVSEPVFTVYDDKSDGFSTESVHVFTNTPEQLTDEEDQHENSQALKLSSKLSNAHVLRGLRWLWDPGDHAILGSRLNKEIFGLPTRVLQQSCYDRVPSSQANQGIQFFWDPGILSIMGMTLGKTAVQNPLHSGHTKFMRSFLVGQPIDLKQFWARMLLQYHSWYSNQSDFLQVPYFLPFLLDCPYSERVRQLVCYSCIYCMSTATTVRTILVLSSGKIVQEERDAAAVYHIFRIQLPMNKTSHIWDHGIRSLMIKYIWLHVHMIQLVACTSIDINIPKWTSTTSNVIRSSEYGYTMDCPNGQWEFLHEEGVHESYSAKNLLPLQSYLQTWEMDIIFITFLPP